MWFRSARVLLNRARPLLADASLYATLIKQCGESKALTEGRRLHSIVLDRGHGDDLLLLNMLVKMYGDCGAVEEAAALFSQLSSRNVYTWTIMVGVYSQNGHLQEARRTFDSMPDKSPVSWNAMIAAYAQHHHGEEAMSVFRSMSLDGGARPNSSTFINTLSACAQLTALQQGRRIHGIVAETGLDKTDAMVGSALLNMYGKCGSVAEAISAFDSMQGRGVIAWTAMITTYAQNGQVQAAERLFGSMPHWNSISWNAIITALVQAGEVQRARSVFDEMITERDSATWDIMLAAYAQAGHLADASSLFAAMPHRSVVSWTIMLSSLSEHGRLDDAVRAFERMPQHDVVARNAMVTALGQNGQLAEAKRVFDSIPVKSVASWNAMAVAYAENGDLTQARAMIESMTLRPNVVSWGVLITAYAKYGQLNQAKELFDQMSQRDVATWNALITAYTHDDQPEAAMALFRRMVEEEGIQPNELSFIAVLAACQKLGAGLTEGRNIHSMIQDRGFDSLAVATALVEMYGKCGSLDEARKVFDKMPQRDAMSWNAMACAYGHDGGGSSSELVLKLFHEMQLAGVPPCSMMFINVLAACSHCGKYGAGRETFRSMTQDFGIEVELEHYLCVLDMLGRAGQLSRAEELIQNMPFEGDDVAWTSLLGASVIHEDSTLAASSVAAVIEVNASNIC